MVDARVDVDTFGGGVGTGSSTLWTETQRRGGYLPLVASVWNETQREGRGACVCQDDHLTSTRSRMVILANASSPAFAFARMTPWGVVLAKARVGELVFQDWAPKVAKQGRERWWGGQFHKNKSPRWSGCRNKSGGGQGSGQCAGGGVYVSKTVDNKRKWLAYLLTLCMFSCLFLPACPSCCIWLSIRSFCACSRLHAPTTYPISPNSLSV